MEGKSTDWVRGPSGPTVCRCCFAEGCYKDISTEYFWMGKREVYAEMLTETFDLSIAFAQTTGPNSNSRLICEPCISRLRDASEFKRQVQECEKMFMQYLDPGRITLENVVEITPEPLEKEVKLERVKLEKGQSDDDFDDRGGFDDMDDDDDLDDQPLTKLASKVPKKESVDLLDLLDNAKAEKRKSSAKAKASPAKKAKTKKDPKATASKPKPEKKKKELDGGKTKAAVKRNMKILLNHSTAYPFKYRGNILLCCFCPGLFEDPAQFRAHMNIQHSNIDIYKALLHKRIGRTRVDITDLRCKSCADSFATLETLITHLNSRHQLGINANCHHGLVPIKLEKNLYHCVFCTKVCATIKTLAVHTGSHFFKYICGVCGKKFELKTGLHFHEQNVHSAKLTCGHCKKSFPTESARRLHIRTTKACQSSKCRICGERFLHGHALQVHEVTVHQQARKTFPCTGCDKVFKERAYLYNHFKTTHTSDNKCTHCGKQFVTVPKLKQPIAREHTGERPLSCEVCGMTFIEPYVLRRHMIIHDDSKKLSCPICNKLFTRRYRYKEHIEKHHVAPQQ